METAFLITTLGFITTLILVKIFAKIAHRWQLLDIPNARSSHQLPLPSGGGIGMIITFLVGMVLMYNFGIVSLQLLKILLTGSIILATIGLLDDFHHVPPVIRISFHLLIAGMVLYSFDGMPPLDLGFKVYSWAHMGTLIGILGLVWLINLYNFMDGIDGLAASEALFVSLSIALLVFLKGTHHLIPILLLVASAAAGFLIWNWSPAKIFMGDTGSGFLGFVFGVLLIATCASGLLTPWQWLIILACFWVDATLTLIRRVIRQEPWYQAHRSHAFQQAVKIMGNHQHVVLRVLAINIFWLLPMAILTLYFPKWTLVLTALAISPVIALCVVLKAGRTSSTTHELDDLETSLL